MLMTHTELISKIVPITRDDIPLTTKIIDKMLLDVDIASAVDKIERALNSKIIYFKSTDIKDDITNIELKEKFDINNYVDVFSHFSLARYYGYSVFEKVYDTDYNLKLYAIPHNNINYDINSNEWQLRDTNGTTVLTDDKFHVAVYKADLGNIKGKSIFRSCYLPYVDKVAIKEKLMGITQKYGDIIKIYPYDPLDKPEEQSKLAKAMKALAGSNVMGVPVNGLGRQGVNANLKDNLHIIKLSDLEPEIFTRLGATEKESLLQRILGSTLGMQAETHGTQALGTIHKSAEIDVVDEMTTFIENEFKNLIAEYCKIAGDKYKDIHLKLESKVDDTAIQKGKIEVTNLKVAGIQTLSSAGYELDEEFMAGYLDIPANAIKKKQVAQGVSFFEEQQITKKKVDKLMVKDMKKKDKLIEQSNNFFLDWTIKVRKSIIEQMEGSKKIKKVDIDFKEFSNIMKVINIYSYLIEKEKYMEFEEEIDPFTLKPADAITYALEKYPIMYDDIEDIIKTVNENMFWVKKSSDLKVTERLLEELQNNLDTGGTFKQWLESISDVVDSIGAGKNGYYLANVYRTNSQSFYNAGTFKFQKDTKASRPYWLYNGISDANQSDICAELTGKVYPADDSIWDTIYPPNHFGCRSSVIALDDDAMNEYNLEVSSDRTIPELKDFANSPEKNWENFKNEIKFAEKEVDFKVDVMNNEI